MLVPLHSTKNMAFLIVLYCPNLCACGLPSSHSDAAGSAPVQACKSMCCGTEAAEK